MNFIWRARKRIKERSSRESGAALVEFAMLMPFLLLLVLGIVEFGWKFGQFNDVRHAVREGARFAAVDGGNDAAIEARVCAALDLVVAGITEVRMSWSDSSDGEIGDPGSIRVEVDVSSLSGVPLISGFLPTQLGSDVQFRLEQPPDSWGDRALSVATC